MAESLNLTGATAQQLRALAATELVAHGPVATRPAVDGRLMTQSATSSLGNGRADPIPLPIGSNGNEASLAAHLAPELLKGSPPPSERAVYAADGPSEAEILRQIFNDREMGAPARWIAGRASRRAPAWLYYFAYVPQRQRGTRPGTNHASEIPFVFDSLDAIPGRSALVTPGERAMAALVHSCWVAFARSGRPDCVGGLAWLAYTPRGDQLLEFNEPPMVRVHFRERQLDLHETLQPPGLLGGQARSAG